MFAKGNMKFQQKSPLYITVVISTNAEIYMTKRMDIDHSNDTLWAIVDHVVAIHKLQMSTGQELDEDIIVWQNAVKTSQTRKEEKLDETSYCDWLESSNIVEEYV